MQLLHTLALLSSVVAFRGMKCKKRNPCFESSDNGFGCFDSASDEFCKVVRRRRKSCFPDFKGCSSSSSSSSSSSECRRRSSSSCSSSSSSSSSSDSSSHSSSSEVNCRPRKHCFAKRGHKGKKGAKANLKYNSKEELTRQIDPLKGDSKRKEEFNVVDLLKIEEVLRNLFDSKNFLNSDSNVFKTFSTPGKTPPYINVPKPIDAGTPEFSNMMDAIADNMEQDIFELIVNNLVIKYNNKVAAKILGTESDPITINLRLKIKKLIKKNFAFLIPFIVLSNTNKEMFEEEVKKNMAKFAGEIEEFIGLSKKLLEELNQRKEVEIPNFVLARQNTDFDNQLGEDFDGIDYGFFYSTGETFGSSE